jgi:hypothetical protein
MSILLHVKCNDVATRKKRHETAKRVIAEFRDKLPKPELLCFFDDEDSKSLKQNFGIANRGFYKPLKSGPHGINGWYLLPEYVKESILVEDPSSLWRSKVADHLIYLHGSTCANPTAFVMTFAHELQHFVQYGNYRDLWAASTVLMNLEREFYPKAGVKIFDIPIELEARIVSKKAALSICGEEEVSRYIESRIAECATPEDVEDWRFVRDLQITTNDLLLAESKRVFSRLAPYRAEIESALALARDDADFKGLNLSPLFQGSK